MKIIIYFLFLFIGINNFFGQVKVIEYSKELENTYSLIIDNDTLSLSQLCDIIPKTEENYLSYYSYTEKGVDTCAVFYELNSLIIGKARSGNRQIVASLMLMSEFVDGEYAESYFEDIQYIAKNNKELFCRLYQELPNNKIYRLSSINEKYCKYRLCGCKAKKKK